MSAKVTSVSTDRVRSGAVQGTSTRPPAWFWPWLAGAGLLAAAVRFLNVLVLRPGDQTCQDPDTCFAINGDALYSHLQGELIAQGHGYASSFGFWLFGDIQPGAGDPPLYPAFLGLVSALHGSGGPGAFLVALGVLAGAVVGTWWVVRRLADTPTARLAAGLAAACAAALLLVSVLPGLGSDQLGVESGGGETVTLPGGDQELERVGRIDESAVVAHRLASSLAGVAGVVLLGLVGRRLAGARAGLITAGVAAVHPMLWINDAMVLSEALYVPVVAVVMLAAYRFWDHPQVATAMVLGGSIALASAVRAEAVLLGAFLVLPLVWGRRRELGWRRGATLVGWAALAALVLLGPWLAYNLDRFEEPSLMTSQTGAVLAAGNCDVAYDGEFVGYYGANCFQQYVDEGWVEWPDPQEEESVRDVPAREGAVRYLEEHLGEVPRVMVFRVARMWDLYRPFSFGESGSVNVELNARVEGRGRVASWAGMVGYFVLLPLGVVGVATLARRRIPVSPLLAQVAVVTVTAALTFGVTRYRVPADAALVVAAAVTLDAVGRRWWPVRDDGDVARREQSGAVHG